MGPALMAEMRAQAERFGAEMVMGNVTAVNVRERPLMVHTADAQYTAGGPHHRDRRVRSSARIAVRAIADGTRRVDVRDL